MDRGPSLGLRQSFLTSRTRDKRGGGGGERAGKDPRKAVPAEASGKRRQRVTGKGGHPALPKTHPTLASRITRQTPPGSPTRQGRRPAARTSPAAEIPPATEKSPLTWHELSPRGPQVSTRSLRAAGPPVGSRASRQQSQAVPPRVLPAAARAPPAAHFPAPRASARSPPAARSLPRLAPPRGALTPRPLPGAVTLRPSARSCRAPTGRLDPKPPARARAVWTAPSSRDPPSPSEV